MKLLLFSTLFALALLFPLSAIAAWKKPQPNEKPFARAGLEAKSGSEVAGEVQFLKLTDGLLVKVVAKNLSKGDHGFHIHEKGDCTAADASSAGEHFNPTGDFHGGPKSGHRHMGDLGNLNVDAEGNAEIRIPSAKPKEPSSWEEIIGKAIVIHASADDLKTGPSGNSGARVACGVIQAVK